jgi:hypothetical protein
MGILDKITNYLNKDIKKARSHLCDFQRIQHELRPADVILIEGRARISNYIRKLTNNTWTHSALYVGRLNDIDDPTTRELIKKNYLGNPRDQLIIESIAGAGTIISPITEYESEHIRICRPNGLHYQDAQYVIQHAANHIGYKYDNKHIFDLGRFYLQSIFIPRRWLSRIFQKSQKESKKEICSTLIGNCFKSIKFPILPLITETETKNLQLIERNTRLLAPCDFDYSPFFNIIKYPIIPEKQKAHYKNFPWCEDLISHDDGLITKDFQKQK